MRRKREIMQQRWNGRKRQVYCIWSDRKMKRQIITDNREWRCHPGDGEIQSEIKWRYNDKDCHNGIQYNGAGRNFTMLYKVQHYSQGLQGLSQWSYGGIQYNALQCITMGQTGTLQCYTKFNTIYKDYKDCDNGAMVGCNTMDCIAMHCNGVGWYFTMLYKV